MIQNSVPHYASGDIAGLFRFTHSTINPDYRFEQGRGLKAHQIMFLSLDLHFKEFPARIYSILLPTFGERLFHSAACLRLCFGIKWLLYWEGIDSLAERRALNVYLLLSPMSTCITTTTTTTREL